MTTTKQYDNLNRLTSTASVGGAPIASFNYHYNSANQRTLATNVDSSYWAYQYDALGQVVSGKKYWADGTPVAGQQFTYNFDDIGNRQATASGGDGSGANLRTASYTANNLNEYTRRDVPGYVTVLGSANPAATVTVNLQRAYRYGSYFQDELAVNNSSAALWLALTNLAVLNNGTNADIIATNTGNVLVPETPEVFGYDLDGNLTNSGRWTIVWDGENRAMSFTSLSSSPAASLRKVDCVYDSQGRRIQKVVSTWNGSAYVAQSTNRFIYDGWNLIGILDGNNNLLSSFQWGTDLSGSQQGAGGVGGLVSMTVCSGTNAGTYFYSFDGNGNVSALVNAANGTIAGQWEYDPFLGISRASGALASINPFLGSTKFYDSETGLYYYGYRYYDSGTGRWLSREPLGEAAAFNVMGFVCNDGVNAFDVLGRYNSAGHFYTTYLVAQAAGISPDQAFQLAYWSQYPDLEPNYNAMGAPLPDLHDVQEYLHSLTGGNPVQLRQYLACLLKSDQFTFQEKGILIHALGDAYAHTYTDPFQTLGSPRQSRPNPNYGKEVLYSFPIGHFLAGHNPDYIASAPDKYGDYVDQLYGILKSINPGATYAPSVIDDMKDAAYQMPDPGFMDFFSANSQNNAEVTALQQLPGGYNGADFPISASTPALLDKMASQIPDMKEVINKIKNGVSGCCPSKH